MHGAGGLGQIGPPKGHGIGSWPWTVSNIDWAHLHRFPPRRRHAHPARLPRRHRPHRRASSRCASPPSDRPAGRASVTPKRSSDRARGTRPSDRAPAARRVASATNWRHRVSHRTLSERRSARHGRGSNCPGSGSQARAIARAGRGWFARRAVASTFAIARRGLPDLGEPGHVLRALLRLPLQRGCDRLGLWRSVQS